MARQVESLVAIKVGQQNQVIAMVMKNVTALITKIVAESIATYTFLCILLSGDGPFVLIDDKRLSSSF